MKNITISVDDALALKLRIASAQADKSLSRFLAETLERTLFPPVNAASSRRVGAAKGEFVVPDSIDAANADIAAMFSGNGSAASQP